MISPELLSYLKIYKWIAVLTLPFNVFGIIYFFIYVKEFSFLMTMMLLFIIIGTLIGIYFVKTWKYYK